MTLDVISNKELILKYLEQMEWPPESVKEQDGTVTIIVSVDLDFKTAKIYLRFKSDGLWLSISSVLVKSITKNKELVYKKLLDINFSTTMTKIGMSDDDAYVLIELPLYSLDFKELQAALRRLTNDMNRYFPVIAGILNS